VIPRTVVSLAALLALACAGAASSKPAASARAGAVAFQTIDQRGIPGQAGGEIRKVARDEASWRALWAELRKDGGDTLPEEPPEIDFLRETAIVVAMPTQSCVSKVTVQSVVRKPGGAEVKLLEAPPAPNCTCIVASRPFHAVRFPRIEGDVRFVAQRGQTPCGPNRY
jgi:hypothetical protein